MPFFLDMEDGTRQVVQKRRFQTTSRRVRTQKMEEFSSITAEAYDLEMYV